MTDEEREFWKAAFLAALPAVIRMPWETAGKPEPGRPETFAFLASRIADESLSQLQELLNDADAPEVDEDSAENSP